MHRASKHSAILLFAMLVACTPEERNYGQGGGGSGGIGGQGGAGGGTGGAGGGDPIAAACDSYAFDVCKRFEACSPASIQGSFGNFETCHTRYELFCAGILGTEGTGWTPSQMKACGEELGVLECNLFLAQPFRSNDMFTPPNCVPPKGALPEGAGCLDHGQCNTGHCHRTTFSLCGDCGSPGAAGDPCGANADCAGGHVCANGTCTQASQLLDPCVEGQVPCTVPWTCVNGTCAKPGSLGASCDAGQPPCNFFEGLYCEPNMKTCTSAVFKMPGEACKEPGTLVFCEGAGVCGQASGTCVAPATEGSNCDPANGPGCMAPAVCLGGKCAIAESSFCP